MIPTPASDPAVVAALEGVPERPGGSARGIVRCHDTPNFIANRIGVFAMKPGGCRVMEREGYSIEEVDLLNGAAHRSPAQRPSSGWATSSGIDIMVDVGRNLYELIPEDTWRGTGCCCRSSC